MTTAETAGWLPRGNARRGSLPRCEQPESNVGLDRRIERFDQHQAATDPALVATKQRSDRPLRHVMLSMQGAHDPRLLERGEPAASVQLAHLHGGIDGAKVGDDGAQIAKAQPSRGA